jgi:hypothetical protein
MKSTELDTFSLKAGKLVFNNLLIKEETNQGLTSGPQDLRGFSTLTVRGSFKNAGDEMPFTLMLVGEDAGGEVAWVCSFAGVAPGGYVDTYESRVSVHPDTLRQTAAIRVRARVGPLPPRGAPLPAPELGGPRP